jgi:hypothetical protein
MGKEMNETDRAEHRQRKVVPNKVLRGMQAVEDAYSDYYDRYIAGKAAKKPKQGKATRTPKAAKTPPGTTGTPE